MYIAFQLENNTKYNGIIQYLLIALKIVLMIIIIIIIIIIIMYVIIMYVCSLRFTVQVVYV